MITQEQIKGNWNELKGALLEKWGELSDDELCRVKGNATELLGTIQKRTGETRESVESFFDSVMSNGVLADSAERAREYAADVSQAAQQQYASAAESVAEGLECAQDAVRRRPAESIAVCFGAGLLAGAVLGLMLRNKA